MDAKSGLKPLKEKVSVTLDSDVIEDIRRLADEDEEVQSFGGIARRFFKAYKQDLLQGILILIFSAASFGLGGYLVYLAYDSGFNLIKIAALAGYFLLVFVFQNNLFLLLLLISLSP